MNYYPYTLEKLIEDNIINSNDDRLIRHLMEQLCKAVFYIHNSLDISHRDIKPSNILLSDHFNLVLSDFGCAKVLSSDDRLFFLILKI